MAQLSTKVKAYVEAAGKTVDFNVFLHGIQEKQGDEESTQMRHTTVFGYRINLCLEQSLQ